MKCSICGGPETSLPPHEEGVLDSIFETLSEIADNEGTGGFSQTEIDFICGYVCSKCAWEYFTKSLHLEK